MLTSHNNYAGAGNSVPFAHVITGFIDESNELSFPDRDPQTYGSRILMENVTYAGNNRYDTTLSVVEYDLRVLFGDLSFEGRLPPPYVGGVEKFRYNNLRVRQVTDYGADWDRTVTLDGAVDYQWFTTRKPGCLSGGYSFKTLAPLHNSLSFPERFDNGVLDINGKVRTSFYSPLNVPPGLPVPLYGSLVHNKVNGVGTFTYDVDTARVGLWGISNCDG